VPQPLPDHLDETTPSDSTTGSRLTRSLDVLGGWAPAITLVAFLALAIAADLPLSSAVRALGALLLTQVLPGALIWRAVRPRDGSWLEDLAMGFAIGSAIAIGAQVVAGTSRMPWLSAGIPLTLVILLVGVPASRRRILEAHTTRLPWWFGPLTSLTTLAALPQLLNYFRQVPLTWASGSLRPHVDAYVHLALAGELAHRGPAAFPWVASEPLAYHWFSHAWVANLSVVSGVGLDATLFRFMPAVLPIVVVVIVATAAMRFTGKAWTGPVAAVLALAGGDLNVFGKSSMRGALLPLSPSLGLSVPILVALVVVLVCRWRGQALSGAFVLIPMLGLAASGTKGSTLPLVVAGLGTAVGAALLFNRSRLRILIIDLAVIIGCLAFSVVVIFHGSAGGLGLALPTDKAHVFTALMVILGVSARGAGLILALATRQGRRDPLTWLLTGAGLAGAGAAALFTQPGSSQGYFAFSAVPLLALGSAVGLASLVDGMGTKVVWPIAIGLIGGVVMVRLPVTLLGLLPAAGSIPHAMKLLAIAGAVLVVVGFLAALTVSPRREAFLGAVMVTILAAGVATFGLSMTKMQLVAEVPHAMKLLAIAGAVLVVVGVLAALTVRSRRDVFLGAVMVTILAAGVATFSLSMTRMHLVTAVTPVSSAAPLAVSRNQIDAARWIRDHSSIEDIVMTNRHCTTPTPAEGGCDSRRLVVAAFSERQVLIEGWYATPRSTELAAIGRRSLTVSYWKPDLLALNDGFIAKPDAAAAAKLSAMGVRWVFVDDTMPHAGTLEPFAHLRFHNAGVDVYQLPKTG